MFTVSSAAETTALTTRTAVKDALSITGTDEDTFIDKSIIGATAAICGYCKVPEALDGTRTFGRETLVETFRLSKCQKEIMLARGLWPVSNISIVEDGVALSSEEFEQREGGVIARLTTDDCEWVWPEHKKIVVTYRAGWLLPNDEGHNLPQEIEDAAIGLIKSVRFNRTRDPLLRSENILESLYSYTLFAPSDKDGLMPADVADQLSRYRYVSI